MLYIVNLINLQLPLHHLLLSISSSIIITLKSYPNDKISLESIDFENNGTSLELIQSIKQIVHLYIMQVLICIIRILLSISSSIIITSKVLSNALKYLYQFY